MVTRGRSRVLVTGATGFLGGHILRALAAHSDVQPIAACRNPKKLLSSFAGEIRVGDLRDAAYRRRVVENVDVVCHAGTWGAFWGHRRQEQIYFFEPTLDLIEQSIGAGVKRFVQPSTVVIGTLRRDDAPISDFAPTRRTGFWPHLDRLVDVDSYMRKHSGRGTQMVTLRLGHFVGAGESFGMISALAPRLRTYLVPWLAGGRKRIPLIADTDLGAAVALAATAEGLAPYESFNICGRDFPTLREVIDFIAEETGFAPPWYSVPYAIGYAFGWLMETLHPLLPGSSPFLTRSIVYVSENWVCPTHYARRKLNYFPQKDWRTAAREALAELKDKGYPWPRLYQAT